MELREAVELPTNVGFHCQSSGFGGGEIGVYPLVTARDLQGTLLSFADSPPRSRLQRKPPITSGRSLKAQSLLFACWASAAASSPIARRWLMLSTASSRCIE